MAKTYLVVFTLLIFPFVSKGQEDNYLSSNYLNEIKEEMSQKWPKNRTINLVFHGHSVPAGYFKTPVVNTLDSYPFQVLKELKKQYPFAVINVINTSIGGENSVSGQKRFKKDVLVHKPDILFIDYALNDRRVGLEKSKKAWEKMIRKATKKRIKVILLTPSPDQKVDILAAENVLEDHSKQIRAMAQKYNIGLVDSYDHFREKVKSGDKLENYMSQGNHPNAKGHSLITAGIMKYFK